MHLAAATLLCLASLQMAMAQQVKADAATDREMTGDPIFTR